MTAHDAVTLRRTGIFCASCARAVALPCEFAVDCVEPRGCHLIGGGIWQSGRPPAIDGNGHVYYFTGNGWTLGYVGQTPHWYRPACTTGQDKPHGYYGESLLRLDPRQALALVGSWTPSDWCDLERNDTDLGGSGPMLIDVLFADGRARTIAIGGGKQGRLYSIDTTRITGPDMVEGQPSSALAGNFNVADPPATCPQTFHGHEHHVMGGPVYWPRAGTGNSRLYVSVESDCVRGFAVTLPRIVDAPPVTLTSAVIVGHPGAILSLSADGGRPGSGVLWAAFASETEPRQGATFDTRPGRLAAYDADDLRRELWNSDLAAAGRDALAHFAKFNPPTVANGKVYAAAFSSPEPYKQSFDSNGLPHTYHAPNSLGHLVVYGLNPPAKPVVRSFAADLVPAILSPLLMY